MQYIANIGTANGSTPGLHQQWVRGLVLMLALLTFAGPLACIIHCLMVNPTHAHSAAHPQHDFGMLEESSTPQPCGGELEDAPPAIFPAVMSNNLSPIARQPIARAQLPLATLARSWDALSTDPPPRPLV